MILVDGQPTDLLPATDSSVLRGDGVFEALRTIDGEPFALEDHLDRLDRSAAAMELEPCDRVQIAEWVTRVAVSQGHALIRIIMTRGDEGGPARTIVMSQPLPEIPSPFSLLAHPAPWHPAGRRWELAGVKTLSYAPNLAATRVARRAGHSDALLISDEGVVLEGPTFCVGWFIDGRFETPSLDLGILASITRAQTIEVVQSIGIDVSEGRFDLARLLAASDVVALSTVKQVTRVDRCGDVDLGTTDLTPRLSDAFSDMMHAQLRR